MSVFGRLLTNLYGFYRDLNPATLTGAIDVVVVEHPDGSLHCSPFHVRFGKLGVISSKEKVVDITINGDAVNIQMKLGDSGEAFFVEDVPESEEESLPAYLATSPINSAAEAMKQGLKELKRDNSNVESTDGSSTATLRPLADIGKMATANQLVIRGKTDSGSEQTLPDPDSKLIGSLAPYSPLSPLPGEIPVNPILKRTASNPEFLLDTFNTDLTPIWENNELYPIQRFLETQLSSGNQGYVSDQEYGMNPQNVISRESRSRADTLDKTERLKRFLTTENETPDSTRLRLYKMGESMPGGVSTQPRSSSKQRRKRLKHRVKKRTAIAKTDALAITSPTSPMLMPHSESWSGSTANRPRTTEINIRKRSDAPLLQPPVARFMLNDQDNESDTENMAPPNEDVFAMDEDHHPKSDSLLMKGLSPDASELLEMKRPIPKSLFTPVAVFRPSTLPSADSLNNSNVSSPTVSRPGTPKSDTEVQMLQSTDRKISGQTDWNWGELPTPQATTNKSIVATSSLDESAETPTASGGSIAAVEAIDGSKNVRGWSWLGFMRSTTNSAEATEDMYLDDLAKQDPEVLARYLKQPSSSPRSIAKSSSTRNSSSSEQSPERISSVPPPEVSTDRTPSQDDVGYGSKASSIAGEDGDLLRDVSLSLCGGLEQGKTTFDEVDFEAKLVSHEKFMSDPLLYSDPNLVLKLNGKYYNWKVAAPILISMLVYKKPLPEPMVEELVRVHMPGISPSLQIASPDSGSPTSLAEHKPTTMQTDEEKTAASWFSWRRTPSVPRDGQMVTDSSGKLDVPVVIADRASSAPPLDKSANVMIQEISGLQVQDAKMSTSVTSSGYYVSSDTESESEFQTRRMSGGQPVKRKALKLSSERLIGLNLKVGRNEAKFSVTSKFQGTSWCICHIYLWRYDDKIVISDIDGTITKSDVLGQILPIMGGQWAQGGVAQLYCRIASNGYRLLYLSSRAIGQSHMTKEYLKSVKQNDLSLPDGPLLLSPSSLIGAFHREVVEKKPEIFKIGCLKDIMALFTDESPRPFYAGFGNRINDVWAYGAVNIPISRIFTINHRGELRSELSHHFISTYDNMAIDFADHMFPPLQLGVGTQQGGRGGSPVSQQHPSGGMRRGASHVYFHAPEQFSHFTYWKSGGSAPISDTMLDLDKFLPQETVQRVRQSSASARSSPNIPGSPVQTSNHFDKK